LRVRDVLAEIEAGTDSAIHEVAAERIRWIDGLRKEQLRIKRPRPSEVVEPRKLSPGVALQLKRVPVTNPPGCG